MNLEPTLAGSHTPGTLANPVNTLDTVTLTCTNVATETATSYNWYKDGQLKPAHTGATWVIGKAKTASGTYRCAVVTDGGTTKKSADEKIAFLCEYHYYFIILLCFSMHNLNDFKVHFGFCI